MLSYYKNRMVVIFLKINQFLKNLKVVHTTVKNLENNKKQRGERENLAIIPLLRDSRC